MNKFVTFFRTLVKSSSDPTYGTQIVRASSWFSWKYFLVFTLLTAIVTAAKILVPVSLFDTRGAIESVADVYPAELQITGDKTGLHINQPLPYSISWPQDLLQEEEVREELVAEDIPMNIVTFTSDELVEGASDIKSYDSMAVITESTIYFREDMDTGELRVYEVPAFDETFTIDRSVVNNLVTTLAENPVIKQRLYIPLIGLVILLFLYPLMLAGRVLTVAIYSLVVFVLVKLFMKAKSLTYGKTFQLGLHTITPVVIAAYVFEALGYVFFHGFLYFVAFAAWTLFMISRLGTSASVPAAPPKPAKLTKARKSKK
jgi:hypothetical protein